MIGFEAVIRLFHGLDAEELRRWVEEEWIRPDRADHDFLFREIDVARVRLIIELRHELDIDEEAMPVVLNLLDQVYALRRRLRAVREALEAQPRDVRQAVLARIEEELPLEDL